MSKFSWSSWTVCWTLWAINHPAELQKHRVPGSMRAWLHIYFGIFCGGSTQLAPKEPWALSALPLSREGHQWLCSVCVSVTVSAVSLCAWQPWDGLCCRLLPPHKMASPPALHTGPSHWKCCCAGKMSCLVALQDTLLQIEEGDGFLTGMLASLHSPSGVASPAAAPGPCRQPVPPGTQQ